MPEDIVWYSGYPRLVRYAPRPRDRYTIYSAHTGKRLGEAPMPNTDKTKTLIELLTDAGWQQPLTNPFGESLEKSTRDQLKHIGWEEPEPEWQYYTATTNHVHGWGCKEDTIVDWQMEYFLSAGGMGTIKGRSAHKHGAVQMRRRESYAKDRVTVQLGYHKDSVWTTINSQAHNR